MTSDRPILKLKMNKEKESANNDNAKLQESPMAEKDARAENAATNDSNAETNTSSAPVQKKRPLLSKEEFQNHLEYFQGKYPKCFSDTAPLPLKVGIHEDLFERESGIRSKMAIRRFLKCYVSRNIYRKSLSVNADRVDLDGNVSSQILEEEVNRKKWKELKAKKKLEQQKANQEITA